MHSKHEHRTAHIKQPRKYLYILTPYSFNPIYIHGGSTRSPFVSDLETMHQAMAKALVKAQRRAAAPQSTGRRQEKRPCTDIVPRTAPQSAVPMDSEPTGAVGARSMIAALQKAASRSARGGSRKVPASAKAPATAGIPPSNHLVVLRVGLRKGQQRVQPRQWRHGVQHQQQQRQQSPPPKPTQAPPHLRHIQRRQAQADALLRHVPPCNY